MDERNKPILRDTYARVADNSDTRNGIKFVLILWPVYPNRGWERSCFGMTFDKSFWKLFINVREYFVSSTIAFLSGSVMNHRRRLVANAGMIMLLIVAVKEITTEPSSILDAAKSAGKERLIL